MRATLLVTALMMSVVLSMSAADLTPTGTLRSAFLATNPVQGRVDPGTKEVTGPVVDLTKELARRLNVPYAMIAAPDARAVIDHLQRGTADIGFLAYEEERAREVDYAAGFALMFNSYLVRAGSPLKSATEADRAGLQIGAARGQTQQIYLSANLKQARVRVFETMPAQAELQRLLVTGEIDAFGLNAQRADDAVAASGSELRILAGSFLEVEQSFVVKKGEKEKMEALNRFVDDVRTSGFLKASLERAKLSGVAVPPARKR
ncbi:MAG: transporter substrate-binding domain-containing protein [Vicinamibacterales bacterium]